MAKCSVCFKREGFAGELVRNNCTIIFDYIKRTGDGYIGAWYVIDDETPSNVIFASNDNLFSIEPTKEDVIESAKSHPSIRDFSL